MATSLENAMVELSKQIDLDFWESTTTSAGAGGGTTIIDTALKAKANDWIDGDIEMFDRISSGTQDEEERLISSLANSTGTLTVLAHGGQIATSVTYEIHRVFTASQKRKALVAAARMVWPSLFTEIRDESHTVDNWIRNGGVETWTVSTVPAEWVANTSTIAENTTVTLLTRGSSSAKIDTSAGSMSQGITQNQRLRALAGQTVTFKAKVHCDTASCARLRIADGTTTTNSEYHPGTSVFSDESGDGRLEDFLEVKATIENSPSEVTFSVVHDVAAGTTYVDDLRVIGPNMDRVFIGDTNFAQERPHEVLAQRDARIYNEPWIRLRNWTIGSDDFLYLPQGFRDNQLRMIGIDYIDFLSSGASSTDWTSTIAVNQPQLDILIAQAAVYLFRTVSMPGRDDAEISKFSGALSFWESELSARKRKHSMKAPEITISYLTGNIGSGRSERPWPWW